MANETESGQELNATQLDAQRARNLLDRALGLAERDDLAGAIVTCRQSLALAPQSPQGWSMLGLLHERDGDIHGAIEAYEKTLQLSPGSTLERESLQRLRQKRGAAPRPAPKFNFDGVSDGAPQVPLDPYTQPVILAPISINSLDEKSTASLWNVFYFRSLPVLIAAVVCLAIIGVAQRVAANRQTSGAQNIPVAPANADAPPDGPAQPTTSAETPSSLAPPAASIAQPSQTPSSETAASTSVSPTPAPVIAPARKPKAVAKPKPQPKPRPKRAVPTEMPVLPPPRLTLPKQSAPAPIVPAESTNDSSSANQPAIDGGPVDVGNSEDSKYIPINPPHFPNASRNQR
jgi:hypothetical protein